VKIGRVFLDLLSPLTADVPVEHGMARTLRRLVRMTGAAAGLLDFQPPRGPLMTVTAAGPGAGTAVESALRAHLAAAARVRRRSRSIALHLAGRRPAALLRAPLGPPGRGEVVLVGAPRAITRRTLPPSFARELGDALERIWWVHRRAVRIQVLSLVTELGTSRHTLDEVLDVFVEGLARLVDFDAIGVAVRDTDRDPPGSVDLLADRAASDPRVVPLDEALLGPIVARVDPLVVDDVEIGGLPAAARNGLRAVECRAALLVPLVSRAGVFGAIALGAKQSGAFDARDVELVVEIARPLAAALEQHRLVDETRRRAEELAALVRTSQLITARLHLASVLDQISRAVSILIGSTGCGIGLIDARRENLVHAAAHGFKTDAWRALSMPVGEGISGRCAATGVAIRVGDIRTDARSARRDIDEQEGIRAMLCVPLKVAGETIGVISAFSSRPGVFTGHHQHVLEAFGEQAGIAIHNAQLFEQSERRARETRALLEAGRAVTASLDVARTVQVIMQQARSVLDVASCSIARVRPGTDELVTVASLDLPAGMAQQIRIRVGEGIAGLAVQERRPVQSENLKVDPRVRYPHLASGSGFRSVMAAPLRVGDRAIGAISVFRKEVGRFSTAEEELLLALADQAAIALEHARLYAEQERVVAERTRELDAQRRFGEVILETIPLGVFVLDPALRVVRANRQGARVLGGLPAEGEAFTSLLPEGHDAALATFLSAALHADEATSLEAEMTMAAETRTLRFTAAPLGASGEAPTHLVVLVDDVTSARRLERQMLLAERLSVAGRLAAGVAHELNNPLATIAGCAEALVARTKDPAFATQPGAADFRHYLGLIEEEAYRCKEITGSLLQFVREPGSRRSPTDLNALIRKARALLSHQSRFSDRHIAEELDPELPLVTANEGQLRQVFLGLAANALEATEGGGVLTIRSRRRRDEVEVEFEDDGPGIPEESLARIFDPFFTTKPPGQGTGLGLAIAQGIVADHGGRIEVTSRPGKGSLFRVVLPA
jgi:signal transduction histidine kinase/putative methionine-R-sulfoxide reductase with GAF domain